MTEAASKKVSKADIVQGHNQIRTTHPSYTEYTWNNLVRQPSAKPENQTGPVTDRPSASKAASNASSNAASFTTARPGNISARNINTSHAANPPFKPGRSSAGVNSNISADTKMRTGAASDLKAKAPATSKAAAKSAVAQKQISAVKIRKKSITTLHTIVSEKRYSFPLSVVLTAISITILVLSIITTSVRISEITVENAKLQRTYNSLVAEENELRLLLETRDDLRQVESIAKNEIGMVKKDQVKKYYMTVHKEDKIELVDEVKVEKRSIFDELMSFGGSIVQRIRAFFRL